MMVNLRQNIGGGSHRLWKDNFVQKLAVNNSCNLKKLE